MLELASNLQWLVLCLLAFGAWIRTSRCHQTRAQRRRALCALFFMALLLLPVVSLSDDLTLSLTAPPPANDLFSVSALFFLRALLALLLISALHRQPGLSTRDTCTPSPLDHLSSSVTLRPPPVCCA